MVVISVSFLEVFYFIFFTYLSALKYLTGHIILFLYNCSAVNVRAASMGSHCYVVWVANVLNRYNGWIHRQ